MTTKGGTTIVYDYDNRPTSIGAATFVYDYAGQRVKKNSTVYIGNIYECTAGVCTKYIFGGGSRIAMKSGATVNYYHTDHLGSSSIVTNGAGAKVEEIHYYPYGATRLNTGSVNVKHKYTGQEEDAETGLYYYGARYYDPSIGRFISADTIVFNPGDPQSLNRYAYCLNNPIIYTDPSGHFSLGDFFEIITGIALVRSTTNDLIDLAPRNVQNFLYNVRDGLLDSVSPKNAIDEGGFWGGVAWLSGGTASYSYQGGWGAHLRGQYKCFYGGIDWQSRGPNGGWSANAGIGYSKGYFAVGYGVSVGPHGVQDGIWIAAQGEGWSVGANYNMTTEQMSGWGNVSLGELTHYQVSTSSEQSSGRPMEIVNWRPGLQHITGREGSKGWGVEDHWFTQALDALALHSTAVVHDNYTVLRNNLKTGLEFYGSMVPSAFIGGSIAGPRNLNPYGFE